MLPICARDVPLPLPLLVQGLLVWVVVVMRQLLVELPPGAYAPGGPNGARVSCTPSASDQPGFAPR